MAKIPKNDLQTIITDPNGAATLVRWADDLGKEFYNKRLTTSQIRALFGEVRRIQAQWLSPGASKEDQQKARRQFILLQPKMRYRSRSEKRVVGDLVDVLQPALELVIRESNEEKQRENFQRFVDFFEAILAYHKGYGGN